MTFRLVAAVAVLAAAPLHANDVVISFSPPSTRHAMVELRHVTSVADLAGVPAVIRETNFDAPLDVDLAPGTWALRIRGEGTWHAEQTFTVAADRTSVTAAVWPSAVVRGKLEIADSKEAGDLRATFAPSDGSRAPFGTIDCNVDQQSFRCELPATALDIRLRIRGYVTKFFWNQPLATTKVVDVGSLRFVRGAVLLGRVEIAPGLPATLRDISISAMPANAESARKITTTARPEDRGFFHIDGLPPGKYDVTAVAGKYRSQAVGIVVLPGLTAEMRDTLRIEPPKTLRVLINPQLDPSQKPWHVTVLRYLSSHHAEPISGSNASATGEWSSPPLYGGTYQLSVSANDGSRWYVDDVQAGESDATKTIDLAVRKVKVLVTLGSKPLRGTVSLSASTSSVAFDTGDDGRWDGVLPSGPAQWDATVTSDAPPVRRSVRGVVLSHSTDSDEAELKIELPLNVITGTVVRKDGKAVDAALVRISGAEGLQSVDVEKDGSFFAAGFGPGSYRVSATAFLMDSPAVEITIQGDTVPDPVQLVLDDSTKVHGQVVSDFGPVAGAEVVIASTDVPQSASPVNLTDEKGEFSTTVAPGAHEIDAFVAAPGFALKFFHTRLQDRSLIVPVDQRGGRVTVPVPPENDPRHAFLVHNGMWYPADALNGRFAHQEGGHLVIPSIDPGAYTLCMATYTEASAAQHGVMLSRPCRTAFLAPYGTLELDGGKF